MSYDHTWTGLDHHENILIQIEVAFFIEQEFTHVSPCIEMPPGVEYGRWREG